MINREAEPPLVRFSFKRRHSHRAQIQRVVFRLHGDYLQLRMKKCNLIRINPAKVQDFLGFNTV